uniref:Uncharacterized protein n=1 Tax=Acrobeloides nanus TaxID=290746 RepID=A0A914DVD6_9BILA
MGNNDFLSDRSNHIYVVDISKPNSSTYNEISVCQQSLQSGEFKTYKTKKSITWIIIVSSIAALLVVSGVGGAGYYIYQRRKEDAREDLISKMLVELQ